MEPPIHNFILSHFAILIQNNFMYQKIENIFNFCEELVDGYDESHDLKHHIDVLKNAIIIYSDTKTVDTVKLFALIFYASMLHDTIDYKYPKNIEEKTKKLWNYLQLHIPNEWENIKWIINNISYSKERDNGYPTHSDPIVQLARDIVSDADKLEAIGEAGLRRCKIYTMAMNPDLSAEGIDKLVVEHCHDKLLKLRGEYIRTTLGKKLAEPKHQVIAEYVIK